MPEVERGSKPSGEFRVWNSAKKEYCEKHYVRDRYGELFYIERLGMDNEEKVFISDYDHLIIEEFTGYYDANNSKIYEGDILGDYEDGPSPRHYGRVVKWEDVRGWVHANMGDLGRSGCLLYEELRGSKKYVVNNINEFKLRKGMPIIKGDTVQMLEHLKNGGRAAAEFWAMGPDFECPNALYMVDGIVYSGLGREEAAFRFTENWWLLPPKKED